MQSAQWQQREMEARQQRGSKAVSVDFFAYEAWILESAKAVTGIPQGSFIRLMTLEEGYTLERIRGEIAALSYRLEEAKKTNLATLEAVEKEIAEYRADILRQLKAVEESIRADWRAFQ